VRTNIVIDDRLMRQAMTASRLTTKRAVVEEGLRLLVQLRAQSRIRQLRGKVKWEGRLERTRAPRVR
jgi:Arc/MetJ family transcription regulator